MPRPYNPASARDALDLALYDLMILSGQKDIAPDVSWQDVCGIAAANLRHLASMLDTARDGKGFERGVPRPEFPNVHESLARVE